MSSIVNVHFEENRRRQGLTFEAEAVEDRSRKGSVDERIVTFVQAINGTDDFFTTSSCSGRAILFTHETDSSSVSLVDDEEQKLGSGSPAKTRKKGCKWLYVTHDEINIEALLKAWEDVDCDTIISFKIEPSIFHIQCRNLDVAKKLVHVATESGFRNSGMVVGKDNKITVAIRSAIGMEVPLQKSIPSIISESFFQLLMTTGNEKLQESWSRTDKLFTLFVKHFVK